MIDPKERPILFTGEMVRAVLDGRKTQTRRVVTPQPADIKDVSEITGPAFNAWGNRWHWPTDDGGASFAHCPYGQPGDLLYVRETWAESPFLDTKGEIIHRADWNEGRIHPMRWRPSIHMPKRAARIWLRVEGVRVERVQDISGPDVLCEGVGMALGTELQHGSVTEQWNRDRFETLWDSINAKRGYGWDANPWVWVVEFERVER